MLHRSMSIARSTRNLQLDLEDILGSLLHARRKGDIGHLALVAYWEVRRWARVARLDALAKRAESVITEHPHATREEFLAVIDEVIAELERVHGGLH
jgi:hypothetical protein